MRNTTTTTAGADAMSFTGPGTIVSSSIGPGSIGPGTIVDNAVDRNIGFAADVSYERIPSCLETPIATSVPAPVDRHQHVQKYKSKIADEGRVVDRPVGRWRGR